MFADRIKEDRQLAAARPGLLDAWISRFRDNRFVRVAAEAGERLFTPGRQLTARLGQGKYLSLSGTRFCRVECRRGAVWVTAAGDGRDRVLTPGQRASYSRGGKVVVSGRGDASEVRVCWD
ncbi:conserved hypothetical protein [Solidesulfovibrio fructosivorans JJ]]|uniref:DUF2917 domain-containing protein n=1 Tax=Solidesulfovibrio fructosivorans JJ] TaxID=596151 RepID=E1K063_SOLFR|nr:DUF2917 domain-containing protein [Solidesulfovibrio fructosivorans]EFL49981.1 conserved hypothetical protein [Solidesulfovibrio fructosivorans JJ]]